MKVKFDKKMFSAQKQPCLLLEALFPTSRTKLYVTVTQRGGRVYLKKPAIQQAISGGLYVWADPTSYDGETCAVRFADTIEDYRPQVTVDNALETMPVDLMTHSLVNMVKRIRNQSAPESLRYQQEYAADRSYE